MTLAKYKSKLSILVATTILLALASMLLIMNYRAQVDIQRKISNHIQRETDVSAQFLKQKLQHLLLENDQLAKSPEVDAYFKNKALGMSFKYGLNASLELVNKLFTKHVEGTKSSTFNDRENKCHTYEHIALFDGELNLLTQWPDHNRSDLPLERIKPSLQHNKTIFTHDNNIYLSSKTGRTSPNNGYLLAIIANSYLYGGLCRSAGISDTLLISHESKIIHPEMSEEHRENLPTILNRAINNSDKHVNIPDEIRTAMFADLQGDLAVFQAPIPELGMNIYRIEELNNIYNKKAPSHLFFTAFLFSSALILFTIRIVSTSARNEGLKESISKLRQRESALADKNRELEFIISSASLGMWVWEIPSGRISINSQWAHMLGYEKNEIDPSVESWIEKVHPDDWPGVKENLDLYFAGKVSLYTTDHRVKHKSGEWRWIRDIGQIFDCDPKGNPLTMRGIHIDITEIKNAYENAENARKEADSVIKKFLDSMLVVDLNLNITRISQETCQLLDYKEVELIGMPISRIFAEPVAVVNQYFNFPCEKNTQDKNELRNVQLTFIKKNRSERIPVSINLSRLTNDTDTTVGVVAGAKDVSKLNLALKKTNEQNRFIRDILDIIPGGILVLDHNLTLVRNNRTFDKLIQEWGHQYGFKQDEIKRKILENLTISLDESNFGKFSLRNGNHEMFLEYHASSSAAQTDKLNRVIFIHDATSRHNADATRKLHSTVLEQTSEGVNITDTRGTIIYTNLAVQQISGYTFAQLQGKNMSVFKSGVQDEAFYREMWTKINNGNVWTGSMVNRAKDGSLFEVEITISPVRINNDEEISYFVSLWRDVSNVRALQQQLLQAQKLEAVGQLAAGIAHEVNTPIQYIQNNLVFFQDAIKDLDPLLDQIQKWIANPQEHSDVKWREQVSSHIEECDLNFLREELPQGIADALSGVDHVARIVGAMKAFSHPGQGQYVHIDFNKLIENAVVVTRNEWKYNAELQTDLDKDLTTFQCDPGAWSQVLLNLIVNSADAIKEAHGKSLGLIKITTKLFEDYLELRVSDNGSGIPPRIKDRIFEPFFTTKDVGKGTGQGLAIVYDIVVNKHKGTIVCESKEGKGTEMIIRVPAYDDVDDGSDK